MELFTDFIIIQAQCLTRGDHLQVQRTKIVIIILNIAKKFAINTNWIQTVHQNIYENESSQILLKKPSLNLQLTNGESFNNNKIWHRNNSQKTSNF